MKLNRLITGVMSVVMAAIVAGCSGSDTGSAKTSANSKSTAKQMSEILPITTAPDNQLNPQVVYLADKNIYFSVWEDYRNRNGSGSDIFGQFINPDGTLCSSAFSIITAPGDQTVPQVAYRQDKAGSDSKLVVTWQDSSGSTTYGYLKYASISSGLPSSTLSGATYSCTPLTPPPLVSAPVTVGYTSVKDYQYAAPIVKKEIVFSTYSSYNYYNSKSFTTTRRPLVPGPNAVRLRSLNSNTLDDIDTTSSFAVSLVDDGNGDMNATSGNSQYYYRGSVNYNSGLINFYNFVPSGTGKTTKYYQIDYEVYSQNADYHNEKLLSRKSPKIVYDSARDEFWLAWIESRDINNLFSTTCWGVPFTWVAGENTFAGYLRMKGSDPSVIVTNGNGTTEADLLRNHETSTARLISASASALTITRTYEFFSAINNVNIASDNSSPETLFAWEGIRQKGVLTCNLDPITGIITSSFASSNYDDGRVHVYGLFDKQILLPSTDSSWIDNTDVKKCLPGAPCTGTNPSISVDDASSPRKFFVAWEDTRDGVNNRIFGQIFYSGGSFYNNNMQISNAITPQDTSFAGSRQTRPAALYDAVNQRFFVAWQDSRNGAISSGNIDVYGQNIDPGGSLSGGNFVIATNIANQLAPAIAYDTLTKQFLYVWKSGETGTSDIYEQLYSIRNSQITLLNMDNTPLTPTLLDFAIPKAVAVGTAAYKSFKIRNTGIAPLTIESVSVPGTIVFSATPVIDSLKPAILPPGSELPITVTYTPVDGTSSAAVVIKSDAADVSVDLNGLGVTPILTPSKSNLTFTNTNVGEKQMDSLIFTNSGTTDVTIKSISGLSGTSAFSLALPPDYSPFLQTFPKTITAGNSLELFILFAPTEISTFKDYEVSIITDSPATNQIIKLNGTGVQAKLTTEPSGTPLDFGSTAIGNTIPKTFRIKNTGNKNLTVNSLTVSGSTAFKPVIPASLLFVPNEFVDITVQFSPTTNGLYSGTLSIVSDGGNATITLSGQGTAGVITLSPSQVDFGITSLNQAVTNVVTVSNTGNAPLNITEITSPGNALFTTSFAGTLPTKLNPGASPILINVTFKSGQQGYSTSGFDIKTDAYNGNQTVSLQASTSSLAITTSSLPAATSGLVYNQTLSASGGAQPYLWSLVTPNGGALPAGLTIDPNTGKITGTPTGEGTYVFVIQVNDASGLSSKKTLSIDVPGSGGSSLVLFMDSGSNPLSNTPYSFGNQLKGYSVTSKFKIMNNSQSAIAFNGASVFKPSTTTVESSYSSTLPTVSTSVAPGGVLDFSITFTPKSLISYPAQLVVTDTNGGKYTLNLTGTGSGVSVSVDTSSETNAYVSSFASLNSSEYSVVNKPANLVVNKAVDMVIRGVSVGGTVPVTVTLDSIPANALFYKVTNNKWLQFTPDSVDSVNKTISYRVKDSTAAGDSASDMDSDPTPTIIHDPVVVATIGSSSNVTTTTPPPSSGGGTGGGGGSGGCFIATAAYGSYLDPHVMALRNFRDHVLLQSEPGTNFVAFYYKHSPPIADFIAQHDILRLIMRVALTPLIFVVKYPLAAALLFVLVGTWLIRRKISVNCYTESSR
ncbi:MAG: choice-of-anchor D domain-containing protein [Desulfuromonadaceae bacterium]